MPWARSSGRKLGRPKGLPGRLHGFDGKEDRNPALPRARSSRALCSVFLHESGRYPRYEALRELSPEHKQQLLANLVAESLRPRLALDVNGPAEYEVTVDRLGIDFASEMRPTKKLFWNRITKGNALEIAATVLGKAWAETHAGKKKGEIDRRAPRAGVQRRRDPRHDRRAEGCRGRVGTAGLQLAAAQEGGGEGPAAEAAAARRAGRHLVNVGAELVSGQFGENRAFRRHRACVTSSTRPAVVINASCILPPATAAPRRTPIVTVPPATAAPRN